MPIATVKLAALLQERGEVHSVLKLMSEKASSQVRGSKDHVLSQAKSDLVRQEHQVGSLNNCICELQQRA